jgi:hypothetical protein
MSRNPMPPRPSRRPAEDDSYEEHSGLEDNAPVRRRDRAGTDDIDQLYALLRRLESRLDVLEERMTDIVGSVREIGSNNRPGMSSAPVERAVMRLSERMQGVEDLVGLEEDEAYPQKGLFGRLLGRE